MKNLNLIYVGRFPQKIRFNMNQTVIEDIWNKITSITSGLLKSAYVQKEITTPNTKYGVLMNFKT
jgi:hypothetical protein